jgi:hypothetical protein
LFASSPRTNYVADYGAGRNRWISVRGRRYKYNYWLQGPAAELYDLAADPGERNNLIHQLPDLAAEMHRQSLEWERDHGLRESVDQERFVAFPAPSAMAEEDCRGVTINGGKWADNLPEEEKDLVDSFSRSFTRAIDGESTLRPGKLSVDLYKSRGGDLSSTPWEAFWNNV